MFDLSRISWGIEIAFPSVYTEIDACVGLAIFGAYYFLILEGALRSIC